MAQVFEMVDERLETYRGDLDRLLRQPSVSATGAGIEECASLLEAMLADYGIDARLLPTSNEPLVYGEIIVDEGLPTVLFYGHYDVQPPGDDADWNSPPFEPTERDGAIYARGSGDNKGQLLAHVFAADALRATRDQPPANIKFLFEGDEESDSRGLREFAAESPPELTADLIYVADGPMHRSGRPTIAFGNRGVLSFELSLRTANADLHSGNFGGPVPNAANELVSVLASMQDETGIAIEGIDEDVRVTEADREAVRRIPLDAAAIKTELGLDRLTVPDEQYYERLLLEPSLSINGLRSGYAGEGMKTIVPSEAIAKADIRLLPEQDPDAVFELVARHVHAENQAISVEKLGGFPPMKTPLDTPAAGDIRAALEAVWGESPVEIPLLGGSLPAAYLRGDSDIPVLVVPYANPDQNNHSPNEHLDVACFDHGIKTSAAFLERFGRA